MEISITDMLWVQNFLWQCYTFVQGTMYILGTHSEFPNFVVFRVLT